MKKQIALVGALMLACGGANLAYAAPAPQAVSASAGIVKGTVVDENGEPIIGASVQVVGTIQGAATDMDGNFSVKAAGNAKLQVSFIGYKTVTVNASSAGRVVLEEDKAQLDELVVVGYGQQRKANLTGAVSNVDVSKSLESKSESDVAKALQGAVPGLTILNSNGDINADASVVIRGIGTLSNNGTSTPLYIVDGVPVENLSYLNSDDIESISVLKDAASSSIYGTRAAFGVIMVTTKSGKGTDKIKISYKDNFAWSQATTTPSYPNVPTQVQALIDANYRKGNAAELFGMYMDSEQFQKGMNNWIAKHGDTKAGYREMVFGDDYDEYGYYANWDVPGIIFNNAAPSQNHNLSITGTSGKTNFFISGNYNQKQNLMNFNPDKIKRYNATANITTQATDWLQVGVRTSYSNKDFEYPYVQGQGSYQYVWRWGSFFGPYGYITGEDGKQYDGRQMIGFRKTAGDAYQKTDNMRLGAFAKVDFKHGLTFNADYTFMRRHMKYKGIGLPSTILNTWGVNPSLATLNTTTFIETSNEDKTNHVFNGYFNFNKSFNDAHNLNVLAGANVEKEDFEYLYYERWNMLDTNLPELALTDTEYTYSHTHTHKGSAGFFGRINYDYKGRYLLELNGRYDGSSQFPKNSQWAFFPSASLGWRFSEEAFFEPAKKYISNGKFRASYGSIGNQVVGDYMFLETMSKVNAGVNWLGTGSAKYDYFGMPKMVPATLTWETINTTNIGLDLGFLRGELNVTFDWFQRDTKDMLAPGKELPSVLGTGAAYGNEGSLRSRGWELTVDYRHRFGDVNFYATANISDYKTKVTQWDSNNLINTSYTGKEYGEIWGFETDRYFDFNDFNGKNEAGKWIYKEGVADQSLLQKGSFVYGPGDVKFKDLDGDGKITWGDGTPENHGDLKKIGNFTPRYQYSLRVGGDWKGIDLDLFFQGVGKRDMWTQSAFVMPMMRGEDAIYANQTSYVTEAEFAAGVIDQSKDFPRLWGGGAAQGSASTSILDGGSYNFYPQTKYLVNMSYLRLKNITVGYTLPKALTQKITLDKVRVYASINNAFDLINHNKGTGLDPEINTGVGSFGNGVWGRTDPIMRSYSFGIQIDL
ncbi:SusC/RagA family TonB-linked outer membrane protein [Sodaliphilus sp.]|uniref:SusC/RagA family TonB-linked outer membrane protein n=1 Tax=Sodaliphilus sp. TaxID=2815818 RepID=UPI00388D2282